MPSEHVVFIIIIIILIRVVLCNKRLKAGIVQVYSRVDILSIDRDTVIIKKSIDCKLLSI